MTIQAHIPNIFVLTNSLLLREIFGEKRFVFKEYQIHRSVIFACLAITFVPFLRRRVS